jgi:anti-anti-sigma factor
MPLKSSQLPKDLYHRLYWYAKRNVDPIRIAASLNLPLKMVQHFIDRFKTEKNTAFSKSEKEAPDHSLPPASNKGDFLDIFIFTKTRYSVVDISGSLDKQHVDKFIEVLKKTMAAQRNPLALKMTDIQHLDKTGAETILFLHAECKQMGRYCAILDPSAAIEPVLKQYEIDKKIKIFGTELGFEEQAFK